MKKQRKKKIIKYTWVLLIIMVVLLSYFLIELNYNKYQNDVVPTDNANAPRLIQPFYNTNHFIVADYVVSPIGGDMTSSIKKALDKCKNNGGGTVFLNRGIYAVSSPITIPSGCALMGDWQDPDNYQGTLDYGTKIVVDVKKFKSDNSNLELTGLFKLEPSSGVEGLTIYYKNQNINNPTKQPWTFHYYFHGRMLYTIKNVTLINSYQGIGCAKNLESGAHEMLMIENVKGTVLKTGVLIHNSADVGTITGMTLSPKYLANANLKAFEDDSSNISEKNIAKAIKKNGGIGMYLTDVEQSQYVDINLSGFKYGIYFPDARDIKSRAFGSGVFYNLNISDCEYGIKAETGIYKCSAYGIGCSMVDERWGYLISNSSIEGSEYAIYNDSPAFSNGLQGTIKLNDVSVKGKVGGVAPVIYNNNGNSYVNITKNTDLTGTVNKAGKFSNLNLYRKLKNNGTNFTYLEAGTSVDKINKALSDISTLGGGVVYLKPGVYKVDKSIVVPKNVELHGSSSVPTRLFNINTTLNVVSNVRAVKITGNNSGVFGINIIYENNVNKLKVGSSYNQYDYSISIENAKNVYIKNISIVASSHGIYINNCSNFTIENIVAGIMDNNIRIDNSSDGLAINVLQNGNVITRNKLFPIDEASTNFQHIMRPNTYLKLTQAVVNNSKNIELVNIFAFGIQKSLSINNSTVYAVNIGKDATSGILLESNNSNVVLVNSLMLSTTKSGNGTNAGTYNVAYPGKIRMADNLNNIFKLSKMYITPVLKTSSTKVSFTKLSKKEISYTYDGDGKLSCASEDTAYVKCSINLNKKVIVITPVANANKTVQLTIAAKKGINYSASSVTIDVNLKTSKEPTITPTPIVTAKPTSIPSFNKGDINGDYKVNNMDYVLVRNHIRKISLLTGNSLMRADINNDSKVNNMDYVLIRNIIRGK